MPILFSQWLEDTGEINPRLSSWEQDGVEEVIPNDRTSYMQIHPGTSVESIVSYDITGFLVQYEVKTQMVDLLASTYFASGCLPGLFNPMAGDIVLRVNKGNASKELMPEEIQLGLITVRGGLVPLERYSHRYDQNHLLAAGRVPIAKCQSVAKPDIIQLRQKLAGMKFGAFYNGHETDDISSV